MWCFSSPTDPGAATPAAAPAEEPVEPAAEAAPATEPYEEREATAPAEPPMCGPGVVAPCRCGDAVITSQMVMHEPPNRARTRMAVGERVELTYSLGDATWAPAGNLSAANGASVTFTAPDRAGTVTLTATGGGCSASITLTIVEPTTVRMARVFADPHHVDHRPNRIWLGVRFSVFVGPDDVNFHSIQIKEADAHARASGALAYLRGSSHDRPAHERQAIALSTRVRPGYGTRSAMNDLLGVMDGPAPPQAATHPWEVLEPGSARLNIPVHWRLGNDGPVERSLGTVVQRFTIVMNGEITAFKAGARASVNYYDPDSSGS